MIGVDEAGRGPLAGPVLVAAVILPDGPLKALAGVRDSKLLTVEKRASYFRHIRKAAKAVSVAWAFPRDIERVNILRATLLAMRRAVLRIPAEDHLVVVDGDRLIPALGRPQQAVVGGDDRSLSVACASIVAKVVRDRWMTLLDRRYPGYGLARHKGYGTAFHLERLSKLGPSPVHRRNFSPVSLVCKRCPPESASSETPLLI